MEKLPEKIAQRVYKLREVSEGNPFFRRKNMKKEDLPTQKMLAILRERGPLKLSECWTYAEREGIRSKTVMKRLLQWLESKFLAYPKCSHEAPATLPGKSKGKSKAFVDDRVFRWAAVPPPPDKPLVLQPQPPEPRMYTRRRIHFRLKRLKKKFGEAYVPPTALKKRRLREGIVYKPYKYGDPKVLYSTKFYPDRSAIILAAVAHRTQHEIQQASETQEKNNLYTLPRNKLSVI